MIDTLHLRLDAAAMEGVHPLSVAERLGFDTYHNDTTGEVWSKGELGNLQLTFNGGGISVKGSLPQWYLGTNARNMTRHDVADAIRQLGETLSVDIGAAAVTRLDVAYHWQMSQPITAYLPCLLSMPRFRRDAHWRGTLYYTQSERTLCFYNKTTEAKKHKKQMPQVLDGMNVLRYELRYMRHVSKHLGAPVTASMLSERVFYCKLISNWYDGYMTITKGGAPVMSPKNIKSARGAFDWLLGHYIQTYGDGLFQADLQQMKDSRLFAYAKYYSQLAQRVKQAQRAVASGSQRELIAELTGNVAEVYNYCR